MEAVELAARCGLVLDPWQELTLDVAMGERPDGSWAAAEVGEIASRQNGKGGTVEARELFGLTVLDEWILHTAHLFPTARDHYLRLLGLIESDPDIHGCLIGKYASPATGYEMRFRGGGRIRFIARSRQSGRGLTGDLLICDEAQDLDDDAQGALLPTISARPGAQVWYIGSAPDATSTVFHRVRKRGRAGTDPRLAYLEFSADPDSDLDDRASWAQANPALGIRITEEAVAAERAAMSDEQFARERLSISPDLSDGVNLVIPTEAWAACADQKSGPVGAVSFALDVSVDRRFASFAVAGTSGRGGTHVELVDQLGTGNDGLVAKAKDLQSKWGGRLAIATGSPAASLLTELAAAKVDVLEVSTGDHAQACGAFYDGVMQRTVHHLGQSMLTIAVAGADRKFYGDSWLWSRRSTQVDISPLVAATLAKWVHDQAPPPSSGFVDLSDYTED